jgi:hypothetical protein
MDEVSMVCPGTAYFKTKGNGGLSILMKRQINGGKAADFRPLAYNENEGYLTIFANTAV